MIWVLALTALVITSAAEVTVMLKVAVPVPMELVALRATLKVPTLVGVPLMRPVCVFTLKPAGSPLAPKLVGELVALIWYTRSVLTMALVLTALVICGTGVVTFKLRVAVPVPPALVALKATPKVPTWVAAPLMSPLWGSRSGPRAVPWRRSSWARCSLQSGR